MLHNTYGFININIPYAAQTVRAEVRAHGCPSRLAATRVPCNPPRLGVGPAHTRCVAYTYNIVAHEYTAVRSASGVRSVLVHSSYTAELRAGPVHRSNYQPALALSKVRISRFHVHPSASQQTY